MEQRATSLTREHPGARLYLAGSSECPRSWRGASGDHAASMCGIGGYVSEDPDDFHVHELPKYRPEGSGEHAMALILKVGRTTDEALKALAMGSGVDPKLFGYAGRKDKHAVTTQWISAHLEPEQLVSADEQVVVLERHAHRHKLKLGHLEGNLFSTRISGLERPEVFELGLARLRAGIPNYFERQRFGRARYVRRPEEGYQPPTDDAGRPLQDLSNLATDNVDTALRILSAPRRRRLKGYEKLSLSALQSALFNLWLGARVQDIALLDPRLVVQIEQHERRIPAGLHVRLRLHHPQGRSAACHRRHELLCGLGGA